MSSDESEDEEKAAPKSAKHDLLVHSEVSDHYIESNGNWWHYLYRSIKNVELSILCR